MSKAWMYECYDPDDGVLVFFADTRNEAKQIAHGWDSYYRRYIDISVNRCPELDHLNHESGYEMDWANLEDRKCMLKIGLHCLPGNEDPDETCKYCDCAEDCHKYQEYKKVVNRCI